MPIKELPERIQIAKAGNSYSLSGTKYLDLDLDLGKKEIAIVLALKTVLVITSVADQLAEYFLFKRSTPALVRSSIAGFSVENMIAEESLVWQGAHLYDQAAGFSTVRTKCEEFHFPYPVVMVNSPQAVIVLSQATSTSFLMYLYYLKMQVSDAELTKLMVKDQK